jgi:hypothetical protein
MSDTTAPIPEFTPEEISGIYGELGGLSVQLDDDPLVFGPKRLNGKVALVRRALDRCERIFLDIAHRLQVARRLMNVAKTDLGLGKRNLLANDPETRGGASVVDRDAIASGKLAKEMALLSSLQILEGDLAAVLDVVKAKRVDLKDAEGRLRDQMRLCQEEIGLGQQWGSQVPRASVDVDQGRPATSASDSIRDIIGSIEGEVTVSQNNGDWTDPPLPDLNERDFSGYPMLEDPATTDKPVPSRVTVPVAAKSVATPAVIEVIPLAPRIPDPPATVAVPTSLASEAVIFPVQDTPSTPEPAATASGAFVDDFLESFPMVSDPQAPAKPRHVALDGDDLMNFLLDFESDPGLPSPKDR